MDEKNEKTTINPKKKIHKNDDLDDRFMLILKVDEISNKSNFQKGQILEITDRGYNNNNNGETGIVTFGRGTDTKTNGNDILFHIDDLYISRNQFSINFQDEKFYLICTSSCNPTCCKILDKPYIIQKNFLFMIGKTRFLVKDIKFSQDLNNLNNLNNEFISFDFIYKKTMIEMLKNEREKKYGKNKENTNVNNHTSQSDFIEIESYYEEGKTWRFEYSKKLIIRIGKNHESDIRM